MYSQTNKKMNSTIYLTSIVNGTATFADGYLLYEKIDEFLLSNNSSKISISLKGVTPMSSSFLNGSFGELYDKYGIDKIKETIVLIESTPSAARNIKDYLERLVKISNQVA